MKRSLSRCEAHLRSTLQRKRLATKLSLFLQPPWLSSLLAEISACIATLGGKVVPRLNWSCPTDAAWISATQSIACTSAEEVNLASCSHAS